MGFFDIFTKEKKLNARNNKEKISEYDYVVFDFETSGLNSKYAEIIEISALKVKNRCIVDTFNTLVKPSKPIDQKSSEINGITDEMLKSAPSLEDILPCFIHFIENYPLVGHNISTFDLPILRRVSTDYMGISITNTYIDTLQLAKKRISNLPDYRLSTIAAYFTIDYSGAHRALIDCEITQKCYEKLLTLTPINVVHTNNTSHHYKTELTNVTKSLRELQGFLMGIVSDGILTETEIFALKKWLDDNHELKGQYPFDRVYCIIEDALDDSILEQSELNEMFNLFNECIDPVKKCSSTIKTITIKDKTFCLTGDFSNATRKEIENLIISLGGICKSSVSGKTNYVLVGSLGSPDWVCGNYGTKIKKALELQKNGNPIQILNEKDFFKVIKNK